MKIFKLEFGWVDLVSYVIFPIMCIINITNIGIRIYYRLPASLLDVIPWALVFFLWWRNLWLRRALDHSMLVGAQLMASSLEDLKRVIDFIKLERDRLAQKKENENEKATEDL